MTFKLSNRSIGRLKNVHPDLVKTVHRAISLSRVDFGVSEGRRTIERQRELVSQGKSQTMKSNHLTGQAVDLVCYKDGNVSWDFPLYSESADAMKEAAEDLQVGIRWGGAWEAQGVQDIRDWEGTMQEMHQEYVKLRKSQGRKAFVDGPHFELFPLDKDFK